MTGKPVHGRNRKRGPPRGERRKAIDEAGIGWGQAWRAEMVGNIPADIFEALIESDNAPTASRLVEIGRQFAGLLTNPPQGRRLKNSARTVAEIRRANDAARRLEKKDT